MKKMYVVLMVCLLVLVGSVGFASEKSEQRKKEIAEKWAQVEKANKLEKEEKERKYQESRIEAEKQEKIRAEEGAKEYAKKRELMQAEQEALDKENLKEDREKEAKRELEKAEEVKKDEVKIALAYGFKSPQMGGKTIKELVNSYKYHVYYWDADAAVIFDKGKYLWYNSVEFEQAYERGLKTLPVITLNTRLANKEGELTGLGFSVMFVIKEGIPEFYGIELRGLGFVDLKTPKGKFSRLSTEDKFSYFINTLKNKNKPVE